MSRLAWAYLQRVGPERALECLVSGLKRFAAAKGHPEKFHYTLTRAWLEMIAFASARFPDTRTAADLLARCPELGDARTVQRFYSAALLDSDRARTGWVEPDLEPLDAAGPSAALSASSAAGAGGPFWIWSAAADDIIAINESCRFASSWRCTGPRIASGSTSSASALRR
jgi:hypothetical protein